MPKTRRLSNPGEKPDTDALESKFRGVKKALNSIPHVEALKECSSCHKKVEIAFRCEDGKDYCVQSLTRRHPSTII